MKAGVPHAHRQTRNGARIALVSLGIPYIYSEHRYYDITTVRRETPGRVHRTYIHNYTYRSRVDPPPP
jgi:hypothetical protein